MARRINRAIEALSQDRAVYYTGAHSGQVLSYAQGRADADTWADYINVGMEHGAFDMTALAGYMRGLVDGGPTHTGHRTPTVVVEAPVSGSDGDTVRHNAWQFRQILGRGVHGIILCQVACADAVRAFVEACRYPIHTAGVDASMPSPHARMQGAARPASPRPLGLGTRGHGSEPEAAAIWGVDEQRYVELCDPWKLHPEGELMLGVKLEGPEGVAACEEILAVPGLAYAEIGPGDLALALGTRGVPLFPYPPDLRAARDRIFAACRSNGLAFLEACTPETVADRIDEGVRVIAGGCPETAAAGRAHQARARTA
jgi:2-keto-3-deoxy-L-rhamnonate aldolase RhmA